MKALVIFTIIALLTVFALSYSFFLTSNFESWFVEDIETNLYQGPIQEGSDESHFRETGETKFLEADDGE